MKGYRESIRQAAIEISNTVDTCRLKKPRNCLATGSNNAKEYEPLSDFCKVFPYMSQPCAFRSIDFCLYVTLPLQA